MEKSAVILSPGTRVRTHTPLGSTGGFFVSERHMSQRKPGAVGAIVSWVPGHGGDVYYVAHLGDPSMAAYGWMEFELEPAKDPCGECQGSGVDWTTSHAKVLCTPCSTCHGTAEKPPCP